MNAKQKLLITCASLFVLGYANLSAQVTIGADKAPEKFSKLEISSDPETPGGVRLPHLSSADKEKIKNDLLADPSKSMGLFIYNTDTNMIEYWDGSQWVSGGNTSEEPWKISGTKESATLNTQSIYQTGRVCIGANEVDTNAVLNVTATNKGVLLPRIGLKSADDTETIPNPTAGMLVFNTGKAGLKYVGYVYWNGDEWRTFSNTSLSNGTIGTIICGDVSISPNTYTQGKEYSGTLTVPYTGGNGGVYPEQIIESNGLTATLSEGNFNLGSGTLIYAITGTPTVSSPETTTFPLEIGGRTCAAIIGAGDVITKGELVYYSASFDASTTNVLMSKTANDLPVIGGKLRLDGLFTTSSNAGTGATTLIPRLVNITSSPVKVWFSALTTVNAYNAGNYLIAPDGYVNLDDVIYLSVGFNDIQSANNSGRKSGIGVGADQEVVTVDVSLDNKWYRIYYFPIVDNMNTTDTKDNKRIVYLSIQRLY